MCAGISPGEQASPMLVPCHKTLMWCFALTCPDNQLMPSDLQGWDWSMDGVESKWDGVQHPKSDVSRLTRLWLYGVWYSLLMHVSGLPARCHRATWDPRPGQKPLFSPALWGQERHFPQTRQLLHSFSFTRAHGRWIIKASWAPLGCWEGVTVTSQLNFLNPQVNRNKKLSFIFFPPPLWLRVE